MGTVESKTSPDALLNKLAAHLAKPFLLPGQSGQPLSLRCLPDGGLVVIAADGRKLWFTKREVDRARQQLDMPGVKPDASAADPKAPRLHDIDASKIGYHPNPSGMTRDGLSEIIVLPKDLKHLEEKVNANARKRQKPRPSNPG